MEGGATMFKDQLNAYIAQLECSGRELAEASGLSAATVSRYRSGERRPESAAEREKLVFGIVRLAAVRGVPSLTEAAVTEGLGRFFAEDGFDPEHLRSNLNSLLTTFSISSSDLARSTNYDASYLSRIRSGQRRPADPDRFVSAVAGFVLRRCDGPADRRVLTELIGAGTEEQEGEALYSRLVQWLGGRSTARGDDVSSFLKQLDAFDLNEYIRTIRFDELKVPTAPFQLPLSKTYYGLEEMKNGELDFLKATVLGRSLDPVFLCSDMPMDDMAEDQEFTKKYMFGLAVLLKKGLHLNVVHNLDRPFHELMLGLEGWIPLYMTGQISPYYLKGVQNNVYCHFLNVSGSAALSGECIAGAHAQGRYELVKGGEALRYYRDRAAAIRKKASALMDIYREEQAAALRAFLLADAQTAGARSRLLAAPPLETLPEESLRAMLRSRGLPETVERRILDHAAAQRGRMETILAHNTVTDRFPELTREEFDRYPPALPLSTLFLGQDVRYSYEEYTRHLEQTRAYALTHKGYTVRPCDAVFRNISISVRTGQWAMVSKSNSPAIHFVIRYPKLRGAIEAFLGEQ